jgi:hypothetical protein
MNLNQYHAVKAAELAWKDAAKWGLFDKLDEIQCYFSDFLDSRMLVMVPRFNGNYISFRYCGLEVFRLSKAGKYTTKIELKGKQIRGLKKPLSLKKLDELRAVLDCVKGFATNCIEEVRFSVKRKGKQERDIPGFSLEHWLENVIMADNDLGKKCRLELGLNSALSKVVTQVPVILKPADGKNRRRHRHIDVLSLQDDGKVVVVELKKDKNLKRAKEELVDYINWLKCLDPQGEGVHDPARGCPAAMMDERYLPHAPHSYKGLKPAAVSAVAVVVKHPKGEAPPINGVKFKIVELAKDWLSRDEGIFVG